MWKTRIGPSVSTTQLHQPPTPQPPPKQGGWTAWTAALPACKQKRVAAKWDQRDSFPTTSVPRQVFECIVVVGRRGVGQGGARSDAVRHCLFLVFPLPSRRLRQRLSLRVLIRKVRENTSRVAVESFTGVWPAACAVALCRELSGVCRVLRSCSLSSL